MSKTRKLPILYGTKAREKILAGIDKVYTAVSTTLGARGGNVAIDKGHETIVVHDGYEVAKNIKIIDPYEKIGADILIQATKRQVDDVGDGTTLVTILAREIAWEMNKLVAAGINAMGLRRGLEELRDQAIDLVKKQRERLPSLNRRFRLPRLVLLTQSWEN